MRFIQYTLFTSCFLLIACSNNKGLLNTFPLHIELDVESDYLSSAQFTISNLQLTDTFNNTFLLDQTPIEVAWLSGINEKKVIYHNHIPKKSFMEFSFDIHIFENSFSFAQDHLQGNVTLIDSLNRIIPSEVKTFKVNLILNKATQSLNELNLTVQFNGDRSVQLLYKDEQPVALFKPYLSIIDAQNEMTVYLATVDNCLASQCTLITQKNNEQLIINWDAVNHLTLDGYEISKEILQRQIEHDNSTWIKVISHDSYQYDFHAFSHSTPQKIISGAMIKTPEGIEIDGQMISDSSPIESKTTTLSQYFYDQSGKQLSISFDDLASGQRLSGAITETTAHYRLEPGIIIAQVASVSPLLLKIISYNNHLQDVSSPILMEINDNAILDIGQLLSIEGLPIGQKLQHESFKLLDSNNVNFSLVMPSSLNAPPIKNIIEGTQLIIHPQRYEDSKITLTIEDTNLHYPHSIDSIDLEKSTITIYNDRLLDGYRVETFSSFKQSEDILKRLLIDAHHINEIHVKGQWNDHQIIANEVDLVFYGSSLYDIIDTAVLENEIMLDTLEKSSTPNQDSLSNTTTAILGSTLTIGAVVMIGGLYTLFKKGQETNPIKTNTVSKQADDNHPVNSKLSNKLQSTNKTKGIIPRVIVDDDVKNPITLKNQSIVKKEERAIPDAELDQTNVITTQYQAMLFDQTPDEMEFFLQKDNKKMFRFKGQDFYQEVEKNNKRYYVFHHAVSVEGEVRFFEEKNDFLTSLDQPIRSISSNTFEQDQKQVDSISTGLTFTQRPSIAEVLLKSKANQLIVVINNKVYQELTNFRGQLVYQSVDMILLESGKVGYFPLKNAYLSPSEVSDHIQQKMKDSSSITTPTTNPSLYQTTVTTKKAPTKKPLQPILNGFESTSRPSEMKLVGSNELGSIFSYNRKFYIELIEQPSQFIYKEVYKIDIPNEPIIYTPVEDNDPQAFDRGVNLASWYLQNYPNEFRQNTHEIIFNGQSIDVLINKREMIDMQVALNYLHRFNQSNQNILFMKLIKNNQGETDVAQVDNAIIQIDNIPRQMSNVQIQQSWAQEIMETRIQYIKDFLASDKKYAILPALPGGHFNAVVFVKKITDGKPGIIPIIIEPGTGYSKEFSASTINQVVNQLPSDSQLGIPLNLKNNVRQVNAAIQIDGCSCGPIALVAATRLIERIDQQKIDPKHLNEAKVIQLMDQIRGEELFIKEPGYPRIRDYMLHTIDIHKKLKTSPLPPTIDYRPSRTKKIL